jgi:undecaprenyl-diphosphatase
VLQDIILGLVQGLTEFLPVSSSGHLVIVPAMLGWDEPPLSLTIFLHLGTLLALLAYFRKEIVDLTFGVFGRGMDPGAARRMVGFLAIGTIPAAVAGLAFGSFFEDAFQRPYETCVELVLTGLLLIVTERMATRAASRELDAPRAVGIGAAQALAILPGISRSGATIGAGLWFGMSREEATRFSFLLSIPAIAGAGVLDLAKGEIELSAAAIAGFVAATGSGYLSIAYLIRFVRTHSLRIFAAYLFVVAPLAALVIALRGNG